MSQLTFSENPEQYRTQYALQSQVLKALAGHFGPFCLTGGSALARYYLLCISSAFSFNWLETISSAHRKSLLSQAFVLRKIARKTENLRLMLNGMVPENAFNLFHISLPAKLDYRVASLTATRAVTGDEPVGKVSTTLEEFSDHLETCAGKLTEMAHPGVRQETLQTEALPCRKHAQPIRGNDQIFSVAE